MTDELKHTGIRLYPKFYSSVLSFFLLKT